LFRENATSTRLTLPHEGDVVCGICRRRRLGLDHLPGCSKLTSTLNLNERT